MQFTLTKNKLNTITYVILTEILKDFDKKSVKPKVLYEKLHMEMAVYGNKKQKEIKEKYSKILKTKYRKSIPEGKIVNAYITLYEEENYLCFVTEKESVELKIQVDDSGYLSIEYDKKKRTSKC